MLCYCTTPRSLQPSSLHAGTPPPTQTWPSPSAAVTTRNRKDASWTGFPAHITDRPSLKFQHWCNRYQGNLSNDGTFERPTGSRLLRRRQEGQLVCQTQRQSMRTQPTQPTAGSSWVRQRRPFHVAITGLTSRVGTRSAAVFCVTTRGLAPEKRWT